MSRASLQAARYMAWPSRFAAAGPCSSSTCLNARPGTVGGTTGGPGFRGMSNSRASRGKSFVVYGPLSGIAARNAPHALTCSFEIR